MSSEYLQSIQLSEIKKTKNKLSQSQSIFRVLCLVIVLILIFCIPGFMKFRTQCIETGLYVFSSDSLKWCGVGFIAIFIIKYSYFALMRKQIQKIIHSKYVEAERVKKTNHVLKLSYDTFFYTSTTVIAYTLFRSQYWFPSIIGGAGTCSNIYKQYPNWPTGTRTQMQIFFMFQLGIHTFSVFEMAVIKRKTQQKFYEYTLHHFVAASLILFSMMCNEIAAGTMILIVHDASDIFMALSRAAIETKWKNNFPLVFSMLGGLIVSWTYLRLIVYPFCLLSNVYINKPQQKDFWYIIHFEYLYLLSMAFLLLGMHIYWTYYLIKSGIKIFNKDIVNAHEKIDRK